jgi:hypothetical protein
MPSEEDRFVEQIYQRIQKQIKQFMGENSPELNFFVELELKTIWFKTKIFRSCESHELKLCFIVKVDGFQDKNHGFFMKYSAPQLHFKSGLCADKHTIENQCRDLYRYIEKKSYYVYI